ncbi:hypothetical protein F5884DRAFT_786735 [Xylogone sp. PMI_703]|nr:hypothetical protein F5884DRAFT_786735 [Xylogone sp. PMI_703]
MSKSRYDQFRSFECKIIIGGESEGVVLASPVALSFWGGVNPETGEIIDHHHPLFGQSLAGKVLVVPNSRGSCSGSGVILELLLNGHSPKALLFERDELILTLGVIVASELFGKSIPIVQLPSAVFQDVLKAPWLRVRDNQVDYIYGPVLEEHNYIIPKPEKPAIEAQALISPSVSLSPFDRQLLEGVYGKAAQAAARIVLRVAIIQNASELIDIKQAHIDGCVYTGPATLKFAQKLNELGAKVRIPASMNSISIDRLRWHAQGVDPALGNPASELADAYIRMGVSPSYTCAPYLLNTAPNRDEHIAWAESNAAVFANSVLGSRTIKCPDYLDICVALTGRAPNSGCHLTTNRRAQIKVELSQVSNADDSLFPLLGYVVGHIAEDRIPIVTRLENIPTTKDDLKAFSAAFATTSSAPMFHLASITPEALGVKDLELQLSVPLYAAVGISDLANAWDQFNRGGTKIDLVSLGNPHFSYDEFFKVSNLCAGKRKADSVSLVITCGRDTYAKAYRDGYIPALEDFGAQIITDTCWCMIVEPVIPIQATTIMTNSAKYAHYGPGLTGRQIRFGSLSQCIDAACSGEASHNLPFWLTAN